MTSTYNLLLTKFKNEPTVKLDDISEEYLGLSKEAARRRAALSKLSINAFRLNNSRKAPWYVRLCDLADLIDGRAATAAVAVATPAPAPAPATPAAPASA